MYVVYKKDLQCTQHQQSAMKQNKDTNTHNKYLI